MKNQKKQSENIFDGFIKQFENLIVNDNRNNEEAINLFSHDFSKLLKNKAFRIKCGIKGPEKISRGKTRDDLQFSFNSKHFLILNGNYSETIRRLFTANKPSSEQIDGFLNILWVFLCNIKEYLSVEYENYSLCYSFNEIKNFFFANDEIVIARSIYNMISKNEKLNTNMADKANTLLFSATTTNQIKEKLKNDWKNINVDHCAIGIKDMGMEILNLTINQPLLCFLLHEAINNFNLSDYIGLLQKIVFTNDKILKIKPVMTLLVDNFTTAALSDCNNKPYTLYDYINVLGICAQLGERKNNYSIDLNTISKDKKLELISIVEESSEVAKIRGNTFSFCTAYYRLIALAKYMAFKNVENTIALNILLNLPDFVDIKDNSTNLIRIDDEKFDRLVVFAFAYVSSLSVQQQESFIRFLCEQSNNFSVEQRENQIKIIYALSYLLCESDSLIISGELRKLIFKSTYGRTSYKLQYETWEFLKNKNTIFVEMVDEYFQKACDKSNPAQPYFFFLYEKSQYRTFKWRKNTWAQNGNLPKAEEVKEEIKNMYIEANKSKTTVTSFELIYAIQALLYCLANIYNRGLSLNLDGETKRKLLEMMFICDFHLRSQNKYYSKDYFFNNGVSFEDWELVLLCGAFRLVCSYDFHQNESDIVFPQLEQKYIESYQYWLANETGRYKALMAFLLTHSSNFYESESMKAIQESLCSESQNSIKFLSYDHLSQQRIDEESDIRKWRIK